MWLLRDLQVQPAQPHHMHQTAAQAESTVELQDSAIISGYCAPGQAADALLQVQHHTQSRLAQPYSKGSAPTQQRWYEITTDSGL